MQVNDKGGQGRREGQEQGTGRLGGTAGAQADTVQTWTVGTTSASDHGVTYTFPSHFFQGSYLFRGGVKFNSLPFGKCNLTFRVLQS